MAKLLHKEIIIVGAGPAGSTAALHFGKAGQEVLLLDQAVFPRDKVCGDALTAKVVAALKDIDGNILEDLHQSGFAQASMGLSFVSPSGETLNIPFRKNTRFHGQIPGYTAPRYEFDHLLLKKALEYPSVHFIGGTRISHIARQEEFWELSDKSGSNRFRAHMLLLANGSQSALPRQVLPIRRQLKDYASGIRAYFKKVKGRPEQNFVELHFLKGLLPGYLWIFPMSQGLVNAGIVLRSHHIRQKRVNLRTLFRQLIRERPGIRERFQSAEAISPLRGFGLPLATRKWPVSGDRFVLMGDSAALTDPFSGEGIGNAMISAQLAAEFSLLAKNHQYAARELKKYDHALYERLGTEFRVSRWVYRFFQYPGLVNRLVKQAKGNQSLRDLLSCMLDDMDVRKKLTQAHFYTQLLKPTRLEKPKPA